MPKKIWLTIACALAVIAPVLIGSSKLIRARETEQNRVTLGVASSLERVEPGVQISPDGNSLAFAARRKGDAEPSLWIQPVASSARQMPGTAGASFPFWSPDGESLGFFAGDQLKTIRIQTLGVRTVCRVSGGRGGDWNRSGDILFASAESGRIFRVPAQSGEVVPVTSLANGELSHLWPRFLADGNRFIYSSLSPDTNTILVYAGALDSPDRSLIVRAHSNALVNCPPTGDSCRLLFLLGRALVSQPFDARTLKTTGQETFVLPSVILSRSLHLAAFSISTAGVLSYSQSEGVYSRRLVMLDRTGREVEQASAGERFVTPRLSPDGRFLAYARMEPDGKGDVWATDLHDHATHRITHEAVRGSFPVWSPDGKQIVYARWRANTSDLFIQTLGVKDGPRFLRASESTRVPTSWSGNGRFIAYDRLQPVKNPNWEVWILPLDDPYQPFCLLQRSANVMDGQFSPDGRWIAFVSSESGRLEVYIAPFTGRPESNRAARRISSAGGAEPKWRSDSRELYYVDDQRNLVQVDVNRFLNGSPDAQQPLYNLAQIAPAGADIPAAGYDVSADGSRFVFNFAQVEDKLDQVRISRLAAGSGDVYARY